MRDRTYIKLLEIAAERRMSLGKLINLILESFVEQYGKENK